MPMSFFGTRFGLPGYPLLLTALVAAIACYLAYRDIQISMHLMLWLQAASVALISVHRRRRDRETRLASGHRTAHIARRDAGEAAPGFGARNLQLGGI